MAVEIKTGKGYRTVSGLMAYVHEEIGDGMFRGIVYKEGAPQNHQFTSWKADGTSVFSNGRLNITEEITEDKPPEVSPTQTVTYPGAAPAFT